MLRERRRHALYKLNGRLDRKSSRGMIYENEELRLRTININAEVERGQSDIKRLRRENEQLRREIWTLRDECDRLNKRVKAKFSEYDHGTCTARCSCGSSGGGGGSSYVCPKHSSLESGCEARHSKSNSDDSESCETCCGGSDEEHDRCSDECCNATKSGNVQEKPPKSTASAADNTATAAKAVPPFDHLSVVSEETLSNSETLTIQTDNLLNYSPDIGGPQTTPSSLVGPLTPLTPVELVASEINDLQSVVPPLSYFENILSQHMGSNTGKSPEGSPPTSTGQRMARQTNGWDYKLESPFSRRKYPPTGASSSSVLHSAPPWQHRNAVQSPLSTFVPTTAATPSIFVRKSSQDSPDGTVEKSTPNAVSSVSNGPTIETVPINTVPAHEPTSINSGAKHFFAPLRPRLKLNTALANKNPIAMEVSLPSVPASYTSGGTTHLAGPEISSAQLGRAGPPDLYITNALATSYQCRQPPTTQSTPPIPTAPPTSIPPPIPQRPSTIQTDSVNLESILNDIETISEDILAMQLEKNKSQENLQKTETTTVHPLSPSQLQQKDKNNKPYRSEMNLLLSYDSSSPSITPAPTDAADATTAVEASGGVISSVARRTRSLEREHTDSPSPNVPAPMPPFPDNRKYIGFDKLNRIATPDTEAPQMARPRLPLSPLAAKIPTVPIKALPPVPPTRTYPSPLSIRCAGVMRNNTVQKEATSSTQSANVMTTPPVPVAHKVGVNSNKSPLLKALANAAAKRAQFRAAPSLMTHSLDTDFPESEVTANAASGAAGDLEPQKNAQKMAEMTKRKARKVSIMCAEDSTPTTPDQKCGLLQPQSQEESVTRGSCSDLTLALPNTAAVRCLKQTSHSTPSSPHSTRRHHSSSPAPIDRVAQQQKPQRQRKASQDTMRSSATDIAAAAANAARSKCSRRHSEGTVMHHQRHQQSAPLLGGPSIHHSHHSRQDSNHETVTSLSDRNSNSLASSRESSASFSIRSHRRKISVSSHTAGKIPWCGCWGNGCL